MSGRAPAAMGARAFAAKRMCRAAAPTAATEAAEER